MTCAVFQGRLPFARFAPGLRAYLMRGAQDEASLAPKRAVPDTAVLQQLVLDFLVNCRSSGDLFPFTGSTPPICFLFFLRLPGSRRSQFFFVSKLLKAALLCRIHRQFNAPKVEVHLPLKRKMIDGPLLPNTVQ